MTLRFARIATFVGILACAGCASPLTHTYWSPNTIAGTEEQAYLSLYFSGKNTFSGHGPCNQFKGRYRHDDNGAFLVSELTATEKMCEPKMMAAEERFMRTLRAARRLTIENGVLVLRDEAGQNLAELGQAEVIIVG